MYKAFTLKHKALGCYLIKMDLSRIFSVPQRREKICLTHTHSQRSSEEYYDNLLSVKELTGAKMIPRPSDLIFLQLNVATAA